jgi:hypothetical protein
MTPKVVMNKIDPSYQIIGHEIISGDGVRIQDLDKPIELLCAQAEADHITNQKIAQSVGVEISQPIISAGRIVKVEKAEKKRGRPFAKDKK